MKPWLRQHAFALGDALRYLLRSRGSFGLNMVVVAVALFLPFAGLTVLENVRPVSDQIAVEPEISIFMAMDTPRDKATALAPQIRRVIQDAQSTGKLDFVPKERALGALKEKTGLEDALAALGENPLPDGYVLKLAGFREAGDAVRVDAIAMQLKSLPGVESVQVDSAWVKRLFALMHVFRLALLFLAVTLGMVVIAVVFNTIRLQVLTQREEIETCRLFGATDAFICRPFYYMGAFLGLAAAAVALVLVTLVLKPLNTAIAEFAHLYAAEFKLAPLGPYAMLLLLSGSALLGLIGALLSVRQQLARLSGQRS